jgi:membrane protein DedA with SNARE-associated domain
LASLRFSVTLSVPLRAWAVLERRVQPTELVGRVILAGVVLVGYAGWHLSNATEIDTFHAVASLVAGVTLAAALIFVTPRQLGSIVGTAAVCLAGAYLGPIVFAGLVVEPEDIDTITSLRIAGTLAAYLLFLLARSIRGRSRRRPR